MKSWSKSITLHYYDRHNEEENMFVHKQAHIKCTLSTNTWEHTNAYIYTFETTTKHVQKNRWALYFCPLQYKGVQSSYRELQHVTLKPHLPCSSNVRNSSVSCHLIFYLYRDSAKTAQRDTLMIFKLALSPLFTGFMIIWESAKKILCDSVKRKRDS